MTAEHLDGFVSHFHRGFDRLLGNGMGNVHQGGGSAGLAHFGGHRGKGRAVGSRAAISFRADHPQQPQYSVNPLGNMDIAVVEHGGGVQGHYRQIGEPPSVLGGQQWPSWATVSKTASTMKRTKNVPSLTAVSSFRKKFSIALSFDNNGTIAL